MIKFESLNMAYRYNGLLWGRGIMLRTTAFQSSVIEQAAEWWIGDVKRGVRVDNFLDVWMVNGWIKVQMI